MCALCETKLKVRGEVMFGEAGLKAGERVAPFTE